MLRIQSRVSGFTDAEAALFNVPQQLLFEGKGKWHTSETEAVAKVTQFWVRFSPYVLFSYHLSVYMR